jgi:hypothetical protein
LLRLLLPGRALGRTLSLTRVLPIPAPDRPVVWATVLLALDVETRDVAENLEPGSRVAANLDLRFDGPKRVDGLVEQIAHDAVLGLITRGAQVANGQVVVNAHVAFDKTSHLPLVRDAVVALEDEQIASTGGAAIALASTDMVGVGQRRPDRIPDGARVAGLSRADAVGQTSFFHGASLRTA